MKNPDQNYVPKEPQKADCPSATCSPGEIIAALQEQIQQDIRVSAEAIEELERDRDEWKERARKSHAEMMAIKERMIKLADAFSEDAASHRKLSDLGQTELTKICHRSAWDAYKNAERRVMDAVHHEAAF
jgi:molecular chaperone GrpE (heat shock protein)